MQAHWGGSRAQKANLKPTWSLCSSPDSIAVGSRLDCGIVHPGVVWPIIRGTMHFESLTPIFLPLMLLRSRYCHGNWQVSCPSVGRSVCPSDSLWICGHFAFFQINYTYSYAHWRSHGWVLGFEEMRRFVTRGPSSNLYRYCSVGHHLCTAVLCWAAV